MLLSALALALVFLYLLRYLPEGKSSEEVKDEVYAQAHKKFQDKLAQVDRDFSQAAAQKYKQNVEQVYRTGKPTT